MRTIAALVTMMFSLTIPFCASVRAQTTAGGAQSSQPVSGTTVQTSQSTSSQTTLDGREFGRHVSGMAPEHPIDHGALFGECVSVLAITGECPHHEHE